MVVKKSTKKTVKSSSKKAVRKELSKTKKSIKKSTSKIMTAAKKRASKEATKQVNSLQKRLHKKGLAGVYRGDSYMKVYVSPDNHGEVYESDEKKEVVDYCKKFGLSANMIRSHYEVVDFRGNTFDFFPDLKSMQKVYGKLPKFSWSLYE